MLKTKVKLLDSKAQLPQRALADDTGYDIPVIGIHKIEGDVIFFKTGISIEPPSGHYFEIVPRSSISKHSLMLANSVGVVDAQYRGELLIAIRVLHNMMGQNIEHESFSAGLVKMFGSRPTSMQSVAQLILNKQPKLCQLILRKRLDTEFEVVQELTQTERADGGFGSTDKKVKTDEQVKIETEHSVSIKSDGSIELKSPVRKLKSQIIN